MLLLEGATAVINNQLYVFGGFTFGLQATKQVYIYNLEADRWTQVTIKSFLKSIGDIGKQPPKQSDELIALINQTTMEYTTLGRTGLRVSAIGLGGGGYSKIGQNTGKIRV